MTTLRDSIRHRFTRAGWRHVAADRVDIFWHPTFIGDVREPVIVLWDRGDDWEPQEHLSGGQWTRHTNHGDVLTSLGHVADRDA